MIIDHDQLWDGDFTMDIDHFADDHVPFNVDFEEDSEELRMPVLPKYMRESEQIGFGYDGTTEHEGEEVDEQDGDDDDPRSVR